MLFLTLNKNLCSINKKPSTLLSLRAPIYTISKRMMLSSIAKTSNRIFIKNSTYPLITKRTASAHAGYLKQAQPKLLNVKDTDVTGKHVVVVRTTCNQTNCTQVNCADNNDPNLNCIRTPQQNQQSIPPTSQGSFTTILAGNLTHQIPPNKPGFIVNPNNDYSGQPKPQAMVKETNTVKVNSADIKIHKAATAFVQKPENAEIIDQNL